MGQVEKPMCLIHFLAMYGKNPQSNLKNPNPFVVDLKSSIPNPFEKDWKSKSNPQSNPQN